MSWPLRRLAGSARPFCTAIWRSTASRRASCSAYAKRVKDCWKGTPGWRWVKSLSSKHLLPNILLLTLSRFNCERAALSAKEDARFLFLAEVPARTPFLVELQLVIV